MGMVDLRGYLRGLKFYYVVVVVLFALIFAFSALFYHYDSSTRSSDFSVAKAEMGGYTDHSVLGEARDIFFNNVKVAGLSDMLFGVAVGFGPIVSTYVNAKLMGLVFAEVVSAYGLGYGSWYFAVAIVPHGIFELSAIFLASSVGFRAGLELGYDWIVAVLPRLRKVPSNEESLAKGQAMVDRLYGNVANGVAIFVVLVVPVLLFAALVESGVTPLIMKLLLGV